jgi:hypothetical protein
MTISTVDTNITSLGGWIADELLSATGSSWRLVRTESGTFVVEGQ